MVVNAALVTTGPEGAPGGRAAAKKVVIYHNKFMTCALKGIENAAFY